MPFYDSEAIERARHGSAARVENPEVHLCECAIDVMPYATLCKVDGIDWRWHNLLSLAGVYQPKKKSEESKLPVAGWRPRQSWLSCRVENKPPPRGMDVNDFLCHRLGIPIRGAAGFQQVPDHQLQQAGFAAAADTGDDLHRFLRFDIACGAGADEDVVHHPAKHRAAAPFLQANLPEIFRMFNHSGIYIFINTYGSAEYLAPDVKTHVFRCPDRPFDKRHASVLDFDPGDAGGMDTASGVAVWRIFCAYHGMVRMPCDQQAAVLPRPSGQQAF